MGFGKKNQLKTDISMYNGGIIGLSGIGKTSISKEIWEKVVGPDGYLFAECGTESGADSISGINFVNCPDWDSEYDDFNNSVGFDMLVDDIITNKKEEYPNLKMLIIDTYDQLRDIAAPEIIRRHNKQHPDKKVTTVKAAFGGYGNGDDMTDDLIINRLYELKRVGVNFFIIGHISSRTITDAINANTYTQVTTDMAIRSFSKIKNRLDYLAVATIHRDTSTVTIPTSGDKTKKKNVISSESRRFTFRDDSYAIDAKSRFASIENEIPFDADTFIKTLEDAIKAEIEKGDKSLDEIKKEDEANEVIAEKKASEYSAKAKKVKEAEELESRRDEFINKIQSAWNNATAEQKEKAKTLRDAAGFSKYTEADGVTLKAIAELF